jgi:hypothetical protein
MCYIEVFFSLGRNKNHHQKGTEKDGGWIMYLESSARRRGLNNQKKKRETLTELLLLYIYFFTCKEKEEKKKLFRSGRENFWRLKSWLSVDDERRRVGDLRWKISGCTTAAAAAADSWETSFYTTPSFFHSVWWCGRPFFARFSNTSSPI